MSEREPGTPAAGSEAAQVSTRASGAQRPRSGFGPSVALGLAGAGLAAVAGNRAWATIRHDASFAGTQAQVLTSIDQARAPLVTSAALVALAAWGVLLVTRGRFRRVIAWLGLVAAIGVLAAAIAAFTQAPQAVAATLGPTQQDIHRTAWAYVALVSAVVALSAAFIGVRRLDTWPEMGRRYDAPAAAAEPTLAGAPAEERTNLDIWKAMDEGHDPTDGDRPLG